MKIEDKTIKAAYQAYFENYSQSKNWDLSHHVEMWELAQSAFKRNSAEDFQKVFDVLRGSWQVFRGAKKHGRLIELFVS